MSEPQFAHNPTASSLTPEARAIAHDLAVLTRAAAISVAPYLRSVARTATTIETKRDLHDPVTVHDRRVEAALHTVLASLVPGSRVLGEETGEHFLPTAEDVKFPPGFGERFTVPTAPEVLGASRRSASLGRRVRWIVDPIDGTANFASGSPYFNTSVAAELDGHVVAGAISVPMSREVFVADAQRVWYESPDANHDLHAASPETEAESVLLSYYPGVGALRSFPEQAHAHEFRLMSAYQATRRPGAGALDLAMIAAGWAGAMIGIGFKPWDVAAGIHMVKVAGGHVLNLPLRTDLPDGLRPGVAAWGRDLDAPTVTSVLREIQEIVDARQ